MRLKNLLSQDLSIGACIAGIGTFDGVHTGHIELIKQLKSYAQNKNLPSVILTFDHSPRRLLEPHYFQGYLTSPEEKFNLLLSTGVDYVVFRSFDESFANIDFKEFVSEILINKLNVMTAFVGFNFFFGQNRKGTACDLQKEMLSFSRDCIIIPPVKSANETISSSKIREALKEGNFDIANTLLGREASFSGEVIHGEKRGRKMGFPTANIMLEKTWKVLPPDGVYACLTDTPSGTYNSIVNIGTRPTFDGSVHLLEAHLFNFEGDLYHQTLRVRFLKKVRNEIRFSSEKELKNQIEFDKQLAISYFK